MTHSSKTADTVSEFGRMIEFRANGDHLWGVKRSQFKTRQRPLAMSNLIMAACDEPQRLTLVLTPC